MSYHKYGILGGTFNPIHNGHLQLAQDALELKKLDRIIFIPAGNPNFKKSYKILNKRIRQKMVEMAIYDNKFFELDDYEINKAGYSYTIDTINYLKTKYKDSSFYFILGEDAVKSLPQWHRAEELKENLQFITAKRSFKGFEDSLGELKKLGYKIEEIPFRYLDISSTDLRKKILMGQSIQYLVPHSVYEFIRKENLYR